MAKGKVVKTVEVDIMHLAKIAAGVVAIIGTIAGVGWGASEYMGRYVEEKDLKAVHQKIEVVQVQVQSVYDVRIEQLTIQRDRLIRKSNKTQQELQDLKDIEKELELARKMRAIK